jgi:hypothetical protein
MDKVSPPDGGKKIGERKVRRTVTITFTAEEVCRILRREAGAPLEASVLTGDRMSLYDDIEIEWTEDGE